MPDINRSSCGDLRSTHVGREVRLAGWVDALRDHGDVQFIHLRDRSGVVQVVFSPEVSPAGACELSRSLKNEFCVEIRGTVATRAQGTENPHIETGTIELMARELTILSRAATLPFPVSEKAMVADGGHKRAETVAEDLRLQYRYLDLRRPAMQDNLGRRYRIIKTARDYLDEQGFIEVETPMLTKSTPEGARDYLVPSRHFPRKFYALPQSPQLFKQLLMVAGFERYFQVVRCFRDEDLRPNRQPEFTQLDLEASFLDETSIRDLTEEMVWRMFRVGGIELPRPFPLMTYQTAMDGYGTDRPDLRFGLQCIEATDIFQHTGYSIFKQILQRGGSIKGINVRGQSEQLSKNVLQNEYAKEIVPSFGAKGMTWMRVMDGDLDSNIVQFFSDQEKQAIIERFDARGGDVLLLIADPSYDTVVSALGQLRLHLGHRLGLISPASFCPVWVTDFPLFTATEEGVTSSHHPFTAPDRHDFDPTDDQGLLRLRSRAYDLVVNGEELGGGSIRIHDKELQLKVFRALGLADDDIDNKFGFFLQALDYGAPPHGGLALGLDRVVAMVLGTTSIREVTAFPKNRSAFCPLTQAPADVSQEQLRELDLLGMAAAGTVPGMEEDQKPIDTLSWVARIGLRDEERPVVNEAVEEAVQLAGLMQRAAGNEEPVFTPVTLNNRMRPPEPARICPFAENGEMYRNAPSVKGDFFKVAGVLDQ
ncbi:aspartate--tRNA ligase [Desulfobulbus alkaliphilus]|uniref:aspartate--tRNA ligase n=1 Tax=Desulfobulbus alkaliphilus TaxID=869814 RepID=UPI00196666E9|nr:aspartate--tRNA ligase [Desulfobulbus alkaliphilus]MBM9538316.1 aspartate--tRNA ligase [Desulfobulbus alkaliphilus]